jgi:DNA polymerase-3 subunit alpha
VIRYVTDKYGDDRVAQIVTYGTIKAKQAVKDASRVLGYPFAMGERLTKAMPPSVMGKDVPLSGIFDPAHKRYSEAEEFRQLHASDPDIAKVVETARGLEGLKRQWGVHAAGVIMSSEPLAGLVPIMRREQDGQIITQFDYPSCETLGLVKMDFLGLRNLTILDDALTNVQASRGITVDLDALSKDLTDPATFELLSAGDTLGVFQFDGGPMRSLLRLMQPDNFEDISAVGAALPARPDGCRLAHQLRAAQDGPAGDHADPPRARPSRWRESSAATLRPDRLPGAGHGDRAEGRPGTPSARPTCCAGDGQEEARGARRRVRGLRAGMRAQRYSGPRCRPCWDNPVPFSDYAFQTRRTARYGWSRTGRRTSRPTTRPSTWPPCSPACATTRTSRRCTWPSAAAWASRCCHPM